MTGLGVRRERIRRLSAERFDVLVIGGGITGAGVALEAAARGLSVALIEQGDFAGGTSSRSTKLVHGGLRYLPMLDFAQVREDLAERDTLLRTAPHLVRPLPFVLPLYAGSRRPLGLRLPPVLRAALPLGVAGGLWMYDILAGHGGVRRHRSLAPAAAADLVPPLRLDGLRRAYLYYDAVTDDARLVIAVLRTASGRGAVAANYVRAVGLLMENGRVAGARAADLVTGQSLAVSARTTVNAAGVWADSVAALGGRPALTIRRSKGVHLVLPADRLRLGRAALVLPETDDGRLAFVVPWNGVALVGTTDTAWEGPPESPPVEVRDVDYLLDHASRYLTVRLTGVDVLGVYAGLRPLVGTAAGVDLPGARLSRRHEIVQSAEGLVTVVGGKLTTYRKMAEEVMSRIHPSGSVSPTRGLALEGAEGLADALPLLRPRARRLGLSGRTSVHLLRSYGTGAASVLDLVAARPVLGESLAPGYPHIAAEVAVAVRDEMACTIGDVLLRRTRLAHLLPQQGREIAARVAALMAEDLGWTPEAQTGEVARFARDAAMLALPDGR
jgi:glycerol-3-phosphate dehydrogenase